MQNVILIIGNGLIIAGTLIHIIALLPVWKLLRLLPSGTIRSRWRILTVLILFFITGYLVFGTLNRYGYREVSDLVVPAIFFCGAIFVFMVCLLSLDTSRDILKVLTLQEENITDPLMGIFNRRYLDRRLNEEVLRSKRYSLPLSVLLLDIDYFKKINDTYGHQIGDFVLKEVGKLIVSLVREVDIVVRYGGEEILIICTHTSDSNALILAERLRQKVEGFEMALPDIRDKSQRPIRITVSIGVAGLSQTTLDYHKLIEDVDRALYTAKKKGRNVVIVNDDANC